MTALPHLPCTKACAWSGELDLLIERRSGRSVATHQYHRGAMKLFRPHYLDDTGQVYYTVVIPGGGYLDGDRYAMAVELGTGASLLFTTQAATKVYRTPERGVGQVLRMKLGEHSVLEYLPDQLIMYREGRYFQTTSVDMAASASAFLAEIVTPGWSPRGDLFAYDELWMRTDISVNGKLVGVDNFHIRPTTVDSTRDNPLIFADRTHAATVFAVDSRLDEKEISRLRGMVEEWARAYRGGDMLIGLSELTVPGFTLRALGSHTDDLMDLILKVANELRSRFRNQGPIDLRKY